MSKRFREPEDTDEALKKMKAKKRRSAKKRIKGTQISGTVDQHEVFHLRVAIKSIFYNLNFGHW